LIGYSVEPRIHPDDVSAHREALRLLLAGECRTYTMEKRYVRPSGQVVWTLVNVSLVTGPEGQPSHFIAAIQDVTERKQAEIALREGQERYRLLAKASKETVWDWDLVTDRLSWEEGTGPLLDYQRSELGDTAAWWYERIHADDRERVLASLDTAVTQGSEAWTEEYRFRRADGSFAVVQDRAGISRDETGAAVRVISANSGLSNAHRADRQLQQVLDALQVGVSVVDKQGRIVVANASDRQLWGVGADQDVPEVADQRGWWADTGEPVRSDEWGALRAIAGEFSADEEVTIETAGGQQKTIRNSATPLLDESGEIVGAVNISQDVTEAKAAEATRIRLEEQVHRAQKMEAVGRLAGGIAHDFNNLLTGILSYSDLILQELRPADPIRADVEQIKDAGRRAAHLSRQLLAFSRRQLLEPKVLSMNALVSELAPMLGRLAGPSVVVETELDPALGNVLVDPARLEEVLVNLVVNAKESMPGGGRIKISSANWREGASGQGGARQGYVSLWVSDTGIGMDAATKTRIFEPFFTTKPPGSGIGLGLSTAYGIMEQSGGNITVDSAPGEGATFGIHFPPYVGTESPEPEQRSVVVGKETLLLVEDEAPIRESVRRLLEWHGYTVIEARNGADALEIYEGDQHGIDLVLTDLIMPGMGGHELVERLRARRPELPVVFMSGYADKEMTSNGVARKDTAYVEKPFTVELLMQRLREVLQGSGKA
jgi:PAS domain S-box-containing protein